MTEPPRRGDDATAPALDEGRTFRADLLHQRTTRLNRAKRVLITAGAALLLVLVVAGVHAWRYFLADLPEVGSHASLLTKNRAPGMTFLDRNGRVLATRGPKYGIATRLEDLPPYVAKAFIAAEDRRFYEHGAVDWRAVGRAVVANNQAGRVVQGGSTISQQLARDLFLGRQRQLKRKVQEALLAERLYKRLGRDGVLELYLNRIYLGGGAYGIDAAARTHFGKPAKQLSLAEAAVLAGIPRSPRTYDPQRNFERALGRGRLVLDLMAAEGWITPAQAAEAKRQRVVLVPRKPEGDFAWVIDMAAAEARERAGPEADLVVRTTIDPSLQTAAALSLRETLESEGKALNASQGAVVLLGPDGAIRALVGGRDPSLGPFNRATQARRQPGSVFKPLVWAAALEAGFSPERQVSTQRVAFGPYRPDDVAGPGELTLTEALVRSSNTVAVRLAKEATPERVASLARRFGVTGAPDRPGLSIALGAYETTLLQMTAAYQPFQQGGRRSQPYLVEEVLGSDGRVIWSHPKSGSQGVYDASRAGAMLRMLTEVVERGTGRRAQLGRPAAGKTGTSQDNRDAWFIGFTPDWLAGVWIGNDDGRPTRGVEGGGLPAEIWRKLMLAAHAALPVRDFDARRAEGVVLTPVAAPEEDAAEVADPDEDEARPVLSTADRDSFYRTLTAEFDRAANE